MASTGQARTRLARAAVIDAARALFLERGYAATTMDAISTASGVPSATVYRLFSSKPGLLRALLDNAIYSGASNMGASNMGATSGDDALPQDARHLPEQPHVRGLFAGPDPWQQVSGFAGVVRAINVQGTGVFTILMSAASSDAQVAGLLAEYAGLREQGQGQLARSLARMGALRPERSEQDAADIVYALASPEVYRLLVTDRGWPPEAYEQWLAATLTSQLLPTAGEARETETRNG